MNKRNHIVVLISLVTTLLLLGTISASAATVKERMLARIPTINSLKDQGLIGENSQGYLEYRTSAQPEKETIQQENMDRQTVYAEIAQKQGVDTGLVGQRRAKQIADIGSPGHWFQKPDGSWYKK